MGCRSDDDRPIADSVFVEVLVDLLIADAYVKSGESIPGVARDSVLQAHRISADQFEATLEHHARDAAEYLRLYDQAIGKLNERRLEMTGGESGDQDV